MNAKEDPITKSEIKPSASSSSSSSSSTSEKSNSITFQVTPFEGQYYELIRKSFLNKKHFALSDQEKIDIGQFLLSSFLVNGSSSVDFDQVPRFSILAALSFIGDMKSYLKKSDDSKKGYRETEPHLHPFFNDFGHLLAEACLLDVGTSDAGIRYENFHAFFELIRWSMIHCASLRDYGLRRSTTEETFQDSFLVPPKKLKFDINQVFLSEFVKNKAKKIVTKAQDFSIIYPNFTQLQIKDGSNDQLKLLFGMPRLVRDPNWISRTDFGSGDIIVPKANQKGFDLIMLADRQTLIKGKAVIEPFMIIFECKHHLPKASGSLPSDVLEKKTESINEFLNNTFCKSSGVSSSDFFKLGNMQVKKKNIAIVFLSAFDTVPKITAEQITSMSKFPGSIWVSTKKNLLDLYGPPLNNAGLFLSKFSSRQQEIENEEDKSEK